MPSLVNGAQSHAFVPWTHRSELTFWTVNAANSSKTENLANTYKVKRQKVAWQTHFSFLLGGFLIQEIHVQLERLEGLVFTVQGAVYCHVGLVEAPLPP